MQILTHSPKIQLYNNLGTTIKYELSPIYNANYPSGQNLLSYSFQKSINNFSSQWSIAIKEALQGEQRIFDQFEIFDVIKIYEDGTSLSYIGVLINISYTASARGNQKVVNISGYGIEYLFQYLTMSLDATAMSYLGSFAETNSDGIMLKDTLNHQGVTIKEAINEIYKSFTGTAEKKVPLLTNTTIIKMINKWYGDDKFDAGNIKFQYPIASNLYQNTTVNLISYLRNLLPQNIYEIYSTIKNNKPIIKIRELPFDLDNNGWKGLKCSPIKSDVLTDYTMTKSGSEVFTVFYSYVEGSILDHDRYVKINSNQDGFDTAAKNENKLALYGYKPLCLNFIGFNCGEADNSETNKSLKENFKKLNNRVKTWYENLDEMYTATISVINNGQNVASIGERISFLNGEFYVTGEDHQWNYGGSNKLIYHCERGGVYSTNTFQPLKNITKAFAEIEV